MQVIINADDFGASHAVNEAVVRAHREGVLTSASLMVTAPAASEAVALARDHPGLAVGLHLALADAPPALAGHQLCHLLGADGRLDADAVRTGWRCFRERRCRAAMCDEIRAQFDRFAQTGLPLSHVDGHMQLHMHPAVFDLVVELAEACGADGIRIVDEPLSLDAFRDAVPGVGRRIGNLLPAVALGRWCRSRLRRSPLRCAARTFGLFRSGWMSPAYVSRVLSTTRRSPLEVWFHPSTGGRSDDHGCNPLDLQALLSPVVRGAIEAHGWQPARYRDLATDGIRTPC